MQRRFIPLVILFVIFAFFGVFYFGDHQQSNYEAVPSLQPTATQQGEKTVVIGSVKSVNTKPWTVGGDAIVILSTNRKNDIRILIPAGESACRFANRGVVNSLKKGETIRVRGASGIDTSTLTVCDATDYIEQDQ